MTKYEALQELHTLKMLRKEAHGNTDEVVVFTNIYDRLFSVVRMKAANDLLLAQRILDVNDVAYKIQNTVVYGSSITNIQFIAAARNSKVIGLKFIDGKYDGHGIIKEPATSVPGKHELEYTDIGYRHLVTLYENG